MFGHVGAAHALEPLALERQARETLRALGYAAPPADAMGEWTEYYRKVGTRRAQAISKVCLAAALQTNAATGIIDDVRIAVRSVAPTVVRARAAEAELRSQPLNDLSMAAGRRALVHDIAPIDDIRSTARYRLRVAQRVLTELLEACRPAGQ